MTAIKDSFQKNIGVIDKTKLYFNTSLGIFLFILFFEPFSIQFDFNNKLLFIAGLSAITFLLLILIYLILPQFFPRTFDYNEWKYNPNVLIYGFILIVNTTAYVFYMHYVGAVPVSFYMVFKLTLISIIPLVVLKINREYKTLLKQIDYLHKENKKLSKLSSNKSQKNEPKFETFYSENKSEKIELELSTVQLISAADNYVKIVYLEEGQLKNKLIRNTLKAIEAQLNIYPDFFRCHRTYIVNGKRVERLNKSYKGYFLKMKQYEEEIPVSQQYIIRVKEALNNE